MVNLLLGFWVKLPKKVLEGAHEELLWHRNKGTMSLFVIGFGLFLISAATVVKSIIPGVIVIITGVSGCFISSVFKEHLHTTSLYGKGMEDSICISFYTSIVQMEALGP